jgi:bla regulator protein BlaR1
MITDFTPALLEGLFRASSQSAMLVGVVVYLQRLLRRWLTPRWRHALWLIVVARLLVPVTPSSPWSLFNLAPARPAPRTATAVRASEPIPANSGLQDWEIANTRPATGPRGLAEPEPTSATHRLPTRRQDPWPAPIPATRESREGGLRVPPPSRAVPARAFRWTWLVTGAWALGVVALVGRVLGTTLGFRRRLRATRPVTHADSNDLLADCRTCLNLRRQ